MKKFLALAALAMAGTAAIAQTAPPAPPVHPMADGAMTRDETVAMVREHFSRLDTDRDGAVTTAEVTARHGQMAQRIRERIAARDPNAAFDRLDANKDGMISRDEFGAARQQRIEKRVERRVERRVEGKDGEQRVMRMHHRGGMGGARMIVMADTDKDGRITLAEAETLALQHFDRMDSNRDGRVTREERRAARPMMMQMRHAPDAG